MRSNATREIIRAEGRPTSSSPWALTGLDRPNLLLVLRGLWVFDVDVELDRLKGSLGRLLSFYPHLAGRMAGGTKVELTNAGVPFTVENCPRLSVAEVTGDHPAIDDFSPPLSAWRVRGGKEPPLKVKVTRLGNGWVLGVRGTHACLDGNSFYTMVSNWGRLCAGRPIVTPTLDQSLVPQASDRPKGEVSQAAAAVGWTRLSPLALAKEGARFLLGNLNERTRAIHFSPEALRQLRQVAAEAAGLSTVSTNVALSAHLTRLCLRLHRHGAGTSCVQVTVVDGRERLAAVPSTFVGNASFPVRSSEFSSQTSLSELVAKIHEGLSPYLERPSAAFSQGVSLALAAQRHRLMMMPFDVCAMHSPKPTVVYINNFSKLPIYDVDFGPKGKPIRPVLNIPHNLPDPVLLWPAPPAQGGVDVFFTGVAARAVKRLDPGDPWWAELRQFDQPA